MTRVNAAILFVLTAIGAPLAAQSNNNGFVSLGPVVNSSTSQRGNGYIKAGPNPPLNDWQEAFFLIEFPSPQHDPKHGAYSQTLMRLLINCPAQMWMLETETFYGTGKLADYSHQLWLVPQSGPATAASWNPMNSMPLGREIYDFTCPGGHARQAS